MTNITLAPPIVGEKNTTAEPKVGTAIKAVEEFLNSNKLDGTSNIKAEGVKESNLELALQEKLSAVLTGVKIKSTGVSAEAATGEMVVATAGGITITLPSAATINREVVVYNTGGTAIKVKCAASQFIHGDFLSTAGEAEVELLQEQHITVQSNGSTSWFIKAGEPKRTQVWINKAFTKVEAEAGVTPSTRRPAYVLFEQTMTALTIGGVTVAQNKGMFYVPAGQAWKATVASGTSTILL